MLKQVQHDKFRFLTIFLHTRIACARLLERLR